jgi:hypothetical protein
LQAPDDKSEFALGVGVGFVQHAAIVQQSPEGPPLAWALDPAFRRSRNHGTIRRGEAWCARHRYLAML